eukprot:scaffold34636_cov18-Tisochrysis_lutea.AAC.1
MLHAASASSILLPRRRQTTYLPTYLPTYQTFSKWATHSDGLHQHLGSLPITNTIERTEPIWQLCTACTSSLARRLPPYYVQCPLLETQLGSKNNQIAEQQVFNALFLKHFLQKSLPAIRTKHTTHLLGWQHSAMHTAMWWVFLGVGARTWSVCGCAFSLVVDQEKCKVHLRGTTHVLVRPLQPAATHTFNVHPFALVTSLSS